MAESVAQSTYAADLQHHTGSRRLSSCWFLSPRKDILFIDDKFQTIFFEISSFYFLHFFFKIWWKPDI